MYNPFSLEGKTILVTGASSGIGAATAIECSKMGAKVVLTARNEERLKLTFSQMEGEGHVIIPADLSNQNSIDGLVDIVPVFDGVVNNAGITITAMTQFVSEEDLKKVLDVNTVAPIMLVQKLLKKKKLGKGASIVVTDSISGVECVSFGNVLYSTSKAAINGFVRNAALDLAQKKIRVNAVCPGMIETHILNAGTISEEQLEIDKQRYPLKRFGKPKEVAYAIIYLLSDASAFTTGSSLVMDGGFTLQ